MNDADNLIKAVNWNDKNWLIDFLNKGADVNALNKHGETALMHSAVQGNAEIAQILIEHGAMLDIQSKEGLTALMLAADNGKKEVAELLLKKRGRHKTCQSGTKNRL
jgi:ankyrin repeat protein